MRKLFLIAPALYLLSCHNSPQPNNDAKQPIILYGGRPEGQFEDSLKQKYATPNDTVKHRPFINYSHSQLLAFLDSIHNANERPLLDSVNDWLNNTGKYADTGKRVDLYVTVSPDSVSMIKRFCKQGQIPFSRAKAIFPGLNFKDTHDKNLYIEQYSFDEKQNQWKKYAIALYPSHNKETGGGSRIIYFFDSNRILAKHYNYYRTLGEDHIYHFISGKGSIALKYTECFDEGSGIWWFQDYYFEYSNQKIIPVLNTVKETNLIEPIFGILRLFHMEFHIKQFEPLIVKVTYNSSILSDSTYCSNPELSDLINDSTLFTYNYNTKTNKYSLKYNEKLNNERLAAFYLSDKSEIFFIHSYYGLLKGILNGTNQKKRKAVFIYLNHCKNDMTPDIP